MSRSHSWFSALEAAICNAVSPTQNSLCCTAVSCIQARDQAAALRATSRWGTAPVCQALDAVTVESLLLDASSHAEQVRCRCKYGILCRQAVRANVTRRACGTVWEGCRDCLCCAQQSGLLLPPLESSSGTVGAASGVCIWCTGLSASCAISNTKLSTEQVGCEFAECSTIRNTLCRMTDEGEQAAVPSHQSKQFGQSVLLMAICGLQLLTAGDSLSLLTLLCCSVCALDSPNCTAPSQDHHLRPRCSFSDRSLPAVCEWVERRQLAFWGAPCAASAPSPPPEAAGRDRCCAPR